MFKILDRYIIRKFLGTFIFSIILLLAIVVMFDINEKFDKFLDVPLQETVFKYFMNFLPYFAIQFSPLFTFIAVIFFTSKLAGNSEIIAMLSAGVSFKRLMRPYLISAGIIALATYLLSAYVIPPANRTRLDYTNMYLRSSNSKKSEVTGANNITLMVDSTRIAYFGSFNRNRQDITDPATGKIKTVILESGKGYNFRLDTYDKEKNLVSRLSSDEIIWDGNKWEVKANSYVEQTFSDTATVEKRGEKDISFVMPLRPTDFLISYNDHELLTTPELVEYIKRQKERGIANIESFEIEYQRRYAITAAAFILTIIGMTLSSKKTKGGMGLNIGIGLALSFSYILFMTVTQTFALTGMTSAVVAMWIPNVIYSIIAFVLYLKAKD